MTFMNRLDRRFSYLQVSAEAHALRPHIVGLGTEAWWPDGLGTKINALRGFVQSDMADNDILVFADAFDVLVFGDRDEIVARFQELERRSNRSLVFNAEQVCFPDREGVCDASTYPRAPHRWRFLNSGLIAGRGRALKSMLRDPVPNVIAGSDQFWYQKYFKEHPNDIALDTGCFLFCALWGWKGEQDGAEMRHGRMAVTDTNTTPSFVHLVSVAHWTYWHHGQATSSLQELFRQLFPAASSRLLDKWWSGITIGSTHDIKLSEGEFWAAMRAVLCVQCNLLGSRERECEYFNGLHSEYCFWMTVFVMLVSAPLAVLTGRRCSRVLFKVFGVIRAKTGASPGLRQARFWLRMQMPAKAKAESLAV